MKERRKKDKKDERKKKKEKKKDKGKKQRFFLKACFRVNVSNVDLHCRTSPKTSFDTKQTYFSEISGIHYPN